MPKARAQPIDRLLMVRSARWLVSDADRQRHLQQHDALAAALTRGRVQFIDSDGQRHLVAAVPRGAVGLGWVFWLLSTLALLLYLVTMVVVMARPGRRNTLYALMALSQAGNLMFLAVLSAPAIGWGEGFMRWEHDARTLFDLLTAGALVHVSNLHPRRLPLRPRRAALAWAVLGRRVRARRGAARALVVVVDAGRADRGGRGVGGAAGVDAEARAASAGGAAAALFAVGHRRPAAADDQRGRARPGRSTRAPRRRRWARRCGSSSCR